MVRVGICICLNCTEMSTNAIWEQEVAWSDRLATWLAGWLAARLLGQSIGHLLNWSSSKAFSRARAIRKTHIANVGRLTQGTLCHATPGHASNNRNNN